MSQLLYVGVFKPFSSKSFLQTFFITLNFFLILFNFFKLVEKLLYGFELVLN